MLTKKGYRIIKRPNHPFARARGWVQEHKLIVEEYLTKKYGYPVFLFPCWIVHHIDGNKLNNELSNLAIVTHKEHLLIHKFDRPLLGKKLPEEWRMSISKGKVGIRPSKTSIEKNRQAHLGKTHSDGWRKNMRMIQQKRSTEASEITKSLWATTEYRTKVIASQKDAWAIRKAKLSQ